MLHLRLSAMAVRTVDVGRHARLPPSVRRDGQAATQVDNGGQRTPVYGI